MSLDLFLLVLFVLAFQDHLLIDLMDLMDLNDLNDLIDLIDLMDLMDLNDLILTVLLLPDSHIWAFMKIL